MSLLAAMLLYGTLCPAFLVWWAFGRGDRQNMSRAPRPRLRKPIDDAWEDRAYGDRPSVPTELVK
jgi:hypothetical protein